MDILSSKAFYSAILPALKYNSTSPQLNWTITDMQAVADCSPALAGNIEGEIITFDFGPRLASNVSISSITSVTCTVRSGNDIDPSSRLSGSATIVASPSTDVAAQAVQQNIIGGLPNVKYLVVCLVHCSDGIPRSIEGIVPFYQPY